MNERQDAVLLVHPTIFFPVFFHGFLI